MYCLLTEGGVSFNTISDDIACFCFSKELTPTIVNLDLDSSKIEGLMAT